MSNPVAVVTGAGSGIGLATVHTLLRDGFEVAAFDLEPPAGIDGVRPFVVDVTQQASIVGAMAQLDDVDVLVNNAGIGAVGTVEENDDDEWHRVYDVNVVGMVRVTRAALGHLRRSPAPAIVNTASIVAWAGLPNRACYSASKGAVLALTLAMAADCLAAGIRVNCVCPGTVDTPWVGRLMAATDDPAATRAALEARQPMGRLATAEEVAEGIAWLASPKASFVTGFALGIDGGMYGLRVPR